MQYILKKSSLEVSAWLFNCTWILLPWKFRGEQQCRSGSLHTKGFLVQWGILLKVGLQNIVVGSDGSAMSSKQLGKDVTWFVLIKKRSYLLMF
jgi:hypothetical protein